MAEMKAKIEAAHAEMGKMITAEDYAGVVKKFYTEDATILTPSGGAHSGHADIEATFKKYDAGKDPWKMEVEDVQGEGGWIMARGSFSNKTMSGKYLTVWKKVGDEYAIYADMFSMSQ